MTAEDSRVTKLVAQLVPLGAAKNAIAVFERAGLVVVDPMSAPYALLTHEYPPTLELAVQTLQRLVTVNQALHQHLADAWDAGARAGWSDAIDHKATPNPYKQETKP